MGNVVDEVGGRGRSDTNRVLLTVVEELFTVHCANDINFVGCHVKFQIGYE